MLASSASISSLKSLGSGGMGVVYRATDTKLDRQVAIKMLPESCARDPERRARFEREARLLASLDHPNVGGIYDFAEVDGACFLVLELVPGATLAERLRGGSLPVSEAMDVCRQMAAALEAAHERGIIHRDLKPANIKITPEGQVKVLDFGLGKALQADSAAAGAVSQSPTITAESTRVGVILGTAAYMSPEQARGKAVDKRTDIWSFGCVLFEVLTGRKAFAGETTSDFIGAILSQEPRWELLPAETPPTVRDLAARCLRKDPHHLVDASGP